MGRGLHAPTAKPRLDGQDCTKIDITHARAHAYTLASTHACAGHAPRAQQPWRRSEGPPAGGAAPQAPRQSLQRASRGRRGCSQARQTAVLRSRWACWALRCCCCHRRVLRCCRLAGAPPGWARGRVGAHGERQARRPRTQTWGEVQGQKGGKGGGYARAGCRSVLAAGVWAGLLQLTTMQNGGAAGAQESAACAAWLQACMHICALLAQVYAVPTVGVRV